MGSLKNSPWLDSKTKRNDVKNLSATELAVLRQFLRDTYAVMEEDVEGVTFELEDGLLASAEILGIVLAPDSNDDDVA